MNRTQFKQRMQSLKTYREQNPGKGYWEWKAQAFENGGENGKEIGEPSEQAIRQKNWLNNWLMNRTKQMVENIDAYSDQYHYGSSADRIHVSPFFFQNKEKNAAKIIQEQLQYANNTPIYDYREPWIASDKNIPNRQKFLKLNSGVQGAYHNEYNKPRTISISPIATDQSVILHELSHATQDKYSIQTSKISDILQKYKDQNNQYHKYYDNPDEVYSRMNQFRYDNGLKPEDIITKEQIEQWKKSSIDNNFIKRYSTNTLEELLNSVAMAYQDGGEVKSKIGKTTTDLYGNKTHHIATSIDDDGTVNLGLPDVVITPRNNLNLAGSVSKAMDNVARSGINVATYVTPLGDVEAVYDVGKNINTGNYSRAALGASLMLLPNFIEKPLKRIGKLLKKNKKIVNELQLDDVKNWTDEDWDFNYNQAINDGDRDKIQRIRDLHFMSKVTNNDISIKDGMPQTWFHGAPYAGHTTFNSSVSNQTIGGESALGREKGNFFTTDINAAKNYATRSSAKVEYPEYTSPKNIKEKILKRIGLYKSKYIHPIDRVPKDLIIDVKNMHSNEVSPSKLIDMHKQDGSRIYQSGKIYPVYVNPGKSYKIDFEGNPWAQSPIEFPSKYYYRESYPDIDSTPTEMYPKGHFIKKQNTSDLTNDLNQLKKELQNLDLPYEETAYDGFGNESLYSKYRDWDSNLTIEDLKTLYPNYKDRPGYSYSIFEYKYPSTTNGAVQYGASEGFNSINIKNVIDANTEHLENYPIDEIVTLKSNQSKLANPITYDNNGKIIPISKRDDFTNPDIRYGLIPLIGFSALKYNNDEDIQKYKDGGEVEPPYPQFINGQRVNRITGKPIATGQAKPLFDLEDFFNFTPVGDAITVKDTYDAAKQNDWSTAALSALTLIPFVPTTVKQFNRKYKGVTPKVKREIPTVNKNQVQEQINDIEKERLRRSRLINEADNQGYKIAERLMEDPAYIKRAAKVQKEYGDDYLTTYADILQAYNENPDLLMKSSLGSLQNGARARMEATSDAVRRHMNGGQFPGMGEYNYRIDPTNMRDLTGNVTDHEWNHYVDYLKNKQPDGQGSSNLFKRMSEDIEYSNNPLDIYYGKPTEQKAYMNQLREYMFQNGIISSRDEEVSKELLQDVLNNLTNRNMDSVVRASRRMNNMDNYTKWFNSIPLLGLGAMGINKYYNQQKEK